MKKSETLFLPLCAVLSAFVAGRSAAAADLIWIGEGTLTSKWDTVTLDWKDRSTGETVAFTPGDNVTFVDTAFKTSVVNIVDKSLEVGKIVFSNDTDFAFIGGFGRTVSQQSRFTSKIGDGVHGVGDWTKYGVGEVFFDTVSSMTNDIHIIEGSFRPGVISIYYQNGPFYTSMIGCPYGYPRKIRVAKNGKLDLSRSPNFIGNNCFPVAAGTDLVVDGGYVDWGWNNIGAYARWHNLILKDGSWNMSTQRPILLVDGTNMYFGGTSPWRILNPSPTEPGSGSYCAFGFDNRATDIYVEDIPDAENDAQIEIPINKATSTGWDYTWAKPQKTWSGAFRKLGPGRLTIAVPRGGNSFTGDVDVVEGALRFACPNIPGDMTTASTPVGSGKVNRTYTIRRNGRLEIHQTGLMGTFGKDQCSKIDFAFLGGTLAFKEPATGRDHIVLYVSNETTFEDATIEWGGKNGLGFGKRLTIRGTQPFVFTNRYLTASGSSYVRFGLATNVTDVSVADITASGAVDATFDVAFANGNWYWYSGNKTTSYYGGGDSFTPNDFRKTGPGTMRLGPNAKDFIGDAHVGEGTLLLDCDLTTNTGDVIRVESGGYLGGCGTIARATSFESGAGLEVATSQGDEILELGALTLLGAEGKVRVVNDTGIDPQTIKNLPVARLTLAAGSQPVDVSRWSGRVVGTKVRCRLTYADGVLYATAARGLAVFIR